MAYQMTAADRRELARLRTEERMAKNERVRSLLSQYQGQPQTVQQQTQQAMENADQSVEDESFLKRAYATTRDIDDQFGFGLAKSIEGLVDIGISVVGAIGGIFDEDFKEQMKRNVEHDFVKENFENSEFAQSARQYSYLGEDAASNMVRQTSRAVGGMLPAIGVSTLTGNPALGIAMMSSSAAGQSTEEAYKDGAGYYEGLGYGVASGLVEAGTEMLFGGVTPKVFGPGLVSKAAKSAGKEVAETGVKRIVKGMAEEAAEEAFAEAVSPLTKTIYKGTDALEEYKDPEFYKGIGESALVGAAAGGVVGGMTGNMSRSADVQASMESLQKLDKMESDYFNKDVLNEDVQGKINASRLANLENIQTALSKMSASKRADTIKNYGLSETFAEDGKIRPEARASLSGEQLTDGENTSQSESVAVDKRYLSPSLWNHAKAVEEDLETIREGYRNKTRDTEVPDVAVFDGELSESAKTAFKQFKRAVAAIDSRNNSKKGIKAGLNFVLLKESPALSGAILRKGNTLYMTADRLTDGSWAKTLVHEVIHFSEGSKAYRSLMNSLAKDNAAVARAIEAIAGEGSRYDYTAEDVESLIEKLEAEEELDEDEQDLLDELNAHLAEEILGNERMIERIVRQDKSLAERILGRIKELAEAFRSLGNKEARAEYKRLKQAEKLFMQAIENAGYKYVDGKIEEIIKESASENVDAEVDASENDVQWKLNTKNYQARLDSWDRKTEGFAFVVGDTPTYLSNIEVNGKKIGKKQVRIDATKIKKIMRDHPEMTIDVIKKLPDLLLDPIVVLDSKTVQGRLVLIGEVYAKEKPVIMALEISPTTRKGGASYIDVIKVASAYTRKNLQNLLNTSNLRYVTENKNRVEDWLKVNRLQLPLPNSQSNSVSTNSITEDSANVNTQAQFSLKKLDTDYMDAVNRGDMEAAQKMVDEAAQKAGYNYKLYHQTGDDFTVFDTRHKGAGTTDSETPFGVFMKPTSDNIGLKGQKQMRVFASINKPLSAKNREGLMYELKKDQAIKDIQDKIKVTNAEYHQKVDQATKDLTEYYIEYRKSHPDEPRKNIYNDAKFKEISDKEDALIKEWGERVDELSIDSKKAINKYLESKGYDGVIVESDVGSFGRHTKTYIALSNTQVKSADPVTYDNSGKVIPLSKRFDITNDDIRFSLKPRTAKDTTSTKNASMELAEETMRRRNFGDLDGVTLRKKANQENEKVYTKKDASEIVSEVLSEHMSFGEVYGTLRGKSREDVVDMLWRGLNAAEEGKRAGVALDVAEYIIRSAAVEDAVEDPANETHRETLDLLKQYVRKLDLSGIRAEINHKYDKKSARIYSRWGKRKDAKGLPPDVAAMELQELGFQIEATHPADILFEIEDAYQKASDALNTQAKAYLRDTMTNEEFKQKQQEIARDILKGFEEKGSKSRLAKTVNDYAERIANLKKELGEQKGRNSLENRVLDRLKKTKDLKLGTYHRSSEFNDARFRGSIERLASIQSRGVLREKKTREIFKELLSWYTAKNELLQGGQFSQEVYDMMEQIATGDGNLTNDDLRLMIKVVDYFNHFVETFNKVYRAGKYVDAEPLVKRYIKSIDKAKDTKISILRKWFESGYYQAFGDPLTLMRYADKYDPNGYYTELFLEFRRGAVGTATTQMQLMESYNQFFKNHKGYEKRLTEETLEYQGKKIPVDEAISLYMTTKRKQAWKAIVKSGVMIELDGKRVRFNPVLEGENVLTETELKAYADYVGKEIYRQMSETDRAFVGIMENVMNNHCAILKRNTDMQRLGYTNVEAGAYYYPIVRAQIAKNLDSESFYDAMDHVSNLSINKNLVEGAQGELLIRPASAIFTRHVRQVSMYANLANALDNFNRMFNLNISDNPGKPITIQSQTSAVEFYRQMNEYVQKLVKDIQGLPVGATDQKWYNDKVRFVRSGFAKYQLGANPKVWVTQFSSFFAAQNILDFDSIVKGFSVKNKASDVDKYCLLAKLRNEENTVVRAQSVVDKTGKIGDILMKPIGMMDRFVVTSLFGACQVQVEKNGGAKVGTDQNMSEAADLLERVILETQQNALATERSGAMRSGDELLKSLTMFSADSMKVFGRFMDAAGELLTLKQNIKSNLLNNAEKATLEKRIQGARKQLMKSTATMVASAAFMALVGLMFRWLYRKDEDKDASEVAADVALDSIGNLIGGLPILRDVYSLFADGYELDNFLLTTLNDVVNATKSTVDLAIDAATGKPVTSQEVASAIRKMVYAAGQIFGIPVRNAYNVVSGLTKRISPSTGYQIENIFYQQSYNSDLAKAIENDDERMISTIAGLIIDEKVGTEDKATREALKALTADGFKVLPRSIGDRITYNEEEIELTKEQQNRFRTVYAASDQAVADLVKLDTFSQASAEEQAKAIRFIYDTYYNLARDDMLGVDSEQKNVLFAEAIPIEKLAIIAAVARSIEADKDKSGKAISGSKKAKVTNYVSKLKLTAAEKYMIMGYLGYTNVNGESQVKSYINCLNLSKNEKQLLLEYSGYKK